MSSQVLFLDDVKPQPSLVIVDLPGPFRYKAPIQVFMSLEFVIPSPPCHLRVTNNAPLDHVIFCFFSFNQKNLNPNFIKIYMDPVPEKVERHDVRWKKRRINKHRLPLEYNFLHFS